MNSMHDIGGMAGLGPLDIEDNEPCFHSEWEARMFGTKVSLAIEGIYNIDETRWAMEQIQGRRWLESSYYEQWIDGVTRQVIEKGLITQEELDARLIELAAKEGA